MTSILILLFGVCVGALFYTYAGYPWLLARWAWRRGESMPRPETGGRLPSVSVLIAAYNESSVIGEKLRSVVASEMSGGSLEILVGDDASSDGTGEIVRRLAREHEQIRLVTFGGRTGKPGVMNELVRRARGEVLIFTDADVMFSRDTVARIAAWFLDAEMRLVAAHVTSRRVPRQGIAVQEDAYVRREIQIKRRQSEVSGVVIAPFGACFAIRKADFVPVPRGFAVDDFFISMSAQRRGGRAVQAIDARCVEDVATESSEQFRRKVRIARGNFQNLAHFLPVALRWWTPLGFHFVSHKVVRWLGPFWLLGSAGSAAWLAGESWFFQAVVVMFAGLAACPLIDAVVARWGRTVKLVRFVSYFLHMNLALAIGLLSWACGQRGSIWSPTRRATARSGRSEVRATAERAAPARR